MRKQADHIASLFWLALVLSAGACSPGPPPFQNGDPMTPVELQGTTFEREHREVSLQRGRWWMVFYFSRDDAAALSRAEHVNKLLARFGQDRVSAVGLVAPNSYTVVNHLRDYSIDYPVLIDFNQRAARKLRLYEREDRLWFIDPQGTLRFTAGGSLLRDDDLRQLLEKYLEGEVSRPDPEKARYLRPGDLFPSSEVADLARPGDPQPGSRIVQLGFNRFVVFTADCVACNLYSYLMRFRAAYPALGGNGRQVGALFSSRFSIAEIGEQSDEMEINAPLFVARTEIEGIEDGYYLSSLIAPVVMVDVDQDGIVQEVKSFDAVWEELEERARSSQAALPTPDHGNALAPAQILD